MSRPPGWCGYIVSSSSRFFGEGAVVSEVSFVEFLFCRLAKTSVSTVCKNGSGRDQREREKTREKRAGERGKKKKQQRDPE
jgi:hypothetical protein